LVVDLGGPRLCWLLEMGEMIVTCVKLLWELLSLEVGVRQAVNVN